MRRAPVTFKQVGDDLGGDRLAPFGLLVLLGVTVIRNDGGDARRRGTTQRVDHQQQLHHGIVDALAVGRFANGLHDEDFRAANVLADLDPRLLVFELGNQRLADVKSQAFGDLLGQAADWSFRRKAAGVCTRQGTFAQ